MAERKIVKAKKPSEAQAKAATAEATLDAPAYSAPSIGHLKRTRRASMYGELKRIRAIEKRKRRAKRKREVEQLGDNAPPPKQQKTQEMKRKHDETFVDPQDEEILEDEAVDEFASYFQAGRMPKVFITTSVNPSTRKHDTKRFVDDLLLLFPNSEYHPRGQYNLKEVIRLCNEKGFTDVIVVNEDSGAPNGMLVSHLPNGPTALFKLTSVRIGKEILNHASSSDHQPEVIVNNFSTRLGHTVARFLASLLPQKPEFVGRRVITFHNQRDFIFVRHHRYIFDDNGNRAKIQEIGPRFTLKLKYLQHGTFDSQFGEYEWIEKKEVDKSRRKFVL